MFKKKLIVHVARLDGTKYSYSPRSLIDVVCNEDGTTKFPFQAFKCAPPEVCEDHLIDRRDGRAMTSESGVFTVVECHGSVAAVQIISIVLSVASAIYAYTQTSNLPSTADLGQSSNNSLSARVNKDRPNQRIEDIAGEVNSVPTLIQLPYRKWIDKKEVEYSYLCVSVGYGVPVNPRDGDTPIEIMAGSGAQFYAPNTSPNNSLPEYSFGQSFNEPVAIIKRSNEVAGGEVLDTINDFQMNIGNKGRLQYVDDQGRIAGISDILYFSDYFVADDIVDVVGGSEGDEAASIAGRYKVASSSANRIFLVAEDGSPANTVNANWDIFVGPVAGRATDGVVITKVGAAELTYAGPFFLSGNLSGFYVNLTANGLVTDSGAEVTIDFDVEYAQADENGTIIGDWLAPVSDSINGRTRDNIGTTVEVSTPFVGNILVRLRRTTDRIPSAQLQDLTVDALYSIESIEGDDFGNITTVQTRVLQSQRASQVKERKFNVNWTRKLPIIGADGVAGAESTTKRFVDYFVYASLSSYIGRRQSWEIDNEELALKYAEIVQYFGDARAAEFCYTFDSDQVSFQDTCEIIARAVFSQAVRKRGVITFKFERPSKPATIFCHRTKIPDQQTITRSFKSDSVNDGVQFTYTDPETNEDATLTVPDATTPIRPQKIESKGVRNQQQAYWLAWRAWNRIKYRRLALNDTFTSEGQLLGVLDVAGVTDDTKAKPQGGEVVFSSGLTLTLSEPVYFEPGDTHSITLRLPSGAVQGIACTNALASNPSISVLLSSPPSESVYTGDSENRTVYTFAADSRANADYYLITDVDRSDQNAVGVVGINYDARYYENDPVKISWIDSDLWIDDDIWVDSSV